MGMMGISFVPGYGVLFTMLMLGIVAGSACFAAMYMFVEILWVLCKPGLYFDPYMYTKYIPKFQGTGSGGTFLNPHRRKVVRFERMYR